MKSRKSPITNFFVIITLLTAVFLPLATLAGVKGTKHDLSITGTGAVKAVEERQICIFCHTPHNSNPAYPLWNHEMSAVTSYTPYFSNTLQSYDSQAGAPPVDGISKLCLSCHDGTVAVGSVGSRFDDIMIAVSPCVDGSGRLIDGSGCTGYIGTDLSGGHPISIVFDDDLANRRNSHEPPLSNLNYPSSLTDRDVRLYPTQGRVGVQCSSCHDPHGGRGGPGAPPFWQKTTYDEVCLVCHQQILPADFDF